MNSYRYAISLRIRHPSIDPREISDTLKLDPSRSWCAGDNRTTPNGVPLEGTWRDSYWTSGDIAGGTWPAHDLASAITELSVRFAPHKDFFERIHAEGGRSEFFVGWYFLGNSGDVITCELMSQLANLKLDLSLDIYPPDRPQTNL